MKSQNRFAIFDLSKFILSVLVINLHVESFITGEPFSLLYYLGKFAVPLFIIFNFYFNGKYYLRGTDNSLYSGKLKRILIPFAIWSLVGFVLSPELITVKYIARQLLTGTAVDAPLYYLLAIFWISIFYFAVSKIFKRITPFHFSLIGIVVLYELFGLNKAIANLLPIQIEFFISRTLEFTKFASIGILLSIYQDKLLLSFGKYSRVIAFVAIVSSLILAVIYHALGRVDIAYSDFGLFAISGVIMLALIVNSHKLLTSWVNKFASLGSYSLGLYCLHTFFIDVINRKLSGFVSVGHLMLTLSIVLLSLVISHFLAHFPKLKPLVQ